MTYLSLSVLCLVAAVVSVRPVRYGDYSLGQMPQYSEQREESEPVERDEYSDKSPEAPARLDYKYEEDGHGQSDDLPVKDIVGGRIWDKRIKKKRKHSISRGDRNPDLDKYSLDETEPEQKSDRFVTARSKFRKRNFIKQNEFQRHLKHNSVDQNDETGNVDSNREYIDKEDLDRAEGVDAAEISHLHYRSTTQRKSRRKPRDRANHRPELRLSNDDAKIELDEMDRRSSGESFKINSPRRNDYDYDEYYDMKRVQRMKNRLPALLRQSTVRTMEAKSTSYFGYWLSRRGDSPAGHSVRVARELTSAVTNTTSASTKTTAASERSSVSTTTKATGTTGNPAELSLAEKSRLSILKKVQRKESFRNVSTSTKPPVLMQVTSKMQTMVMVEPRISGGEAAMRAREVSDDTPERLRRARRLMRHKLVAGARSIHELTDNWDQMICDYIDVSLLDTDAASRPPVDAYVTVLLFLFSLFICG